MNETHPISIAIDGPSGAGKSTLARRLATTLRFLYVDTGAIYRTIAYYAYANHLDPADEAAVLAALPNIRIELCHDAEGLQRMILNGEDVTDAIRLPQISQYASVVSTTTASSACRRGAVSRWESSQSRCWISEST